MTLEETGSPVSEVLLQCEQARSAISAAWACIADGNRGGAQTCLAAARQHIETIGKHVKGVGEPSPIVEFQQGQKLWAIAVVRDCGAIMSVGVIDPRPRKEMILVEELLTGRRTEWEMGCLFQDVIDAAIKVVEMEKRAEQESQSSVKKEA